MDWTTAQLIRRPFLRGVKLKVYVAGPMSGYPEYNFPAFRAAASDLRSQGWEVISPAEMDEEEGVVPPADAGQAPTPVEYARFLARDIKRIADEGVEAIVVLDGWEASGGAKVEVAFGRALRMHILSYPSMMPVVWGDAYPMTAGDYEEVVPYA